MRLTAAERAAIEQTFVEVFQKGEVVLFGSRVDDSKRGGDIDLYIAPKTHSPSVFEQKIAFLVALKQRIGEQKVDVLIEPLVSEAFRNEAKATGEVLCRR